MAIWQRLTEQRVCDRSKPAYLHVLQAVLLSNRSQDVLLATLLHLPSKQELIEYEVCLLEVEDDVQLADIAVVFIHLFYVSVHDLECDELIVGRVAAGDEEEGGISTIYNLRVCTCSQRVPPLTLR